MGTRALHAVLNPLEKKRSRSKHNDVRPTASDHVFGIQIETELVFPVIGGKTLDTVCNSCHRPVLRGQHLNWQCTAVTGILRFGICFDCIQFARNFWGREHTLNAGGTVRNKKLKPVPPVQAQHADVCCVCGKVQRIGGYAWVGRRKGVGWQ